MSRFNNGWFRVDRKLVNEDIGQNGHTLAVFITLLSWACRFETKIRWGQEQKILPIGSIALGISELAEHLGFSKTTVYRSLQYLERRGTICIDSGTRGTIVSVCNWKGYQCLENQSETLAEHLRNDRETLAEHERTLNGQVDKETKRQETRKTNVGIRADYPQDFDSVWLKYGKRGDKKAAFEEWKKLKLSELEIAMLNRSVDHYVKNNELKFRKHFCRFLKTDWRELEPALETSHDTKPKWLQNAGSPGVDPWDEGEAANG